MMYLKRPMLFCCVVHVLLCSPERSTAQIHWPVNVHKRWNVIVPQSRIIVPDQTPTIEVTKVDVRVVIMEQIATTTMDFVLENSTGHRLEAELVVPVPDGAVIRGLDFQGTAPEPTAKVLPLGEAKRTYESIVARIRDPALLEFIGYNLIQTSVFPLEAGSTQKVRLIYEHLLPGDGGRRDYVLVRSESLDYTLPWTISIRITTKAAISTVYSPSHALETVRSSTNSLSIRVAELAKTNPGPFRLSYLLENDGVAATLMAYPDPASGGGYYLLLAGLPAKPNLGSGGKAIKRELTLVIDHSGSMNGEKIEQVRSAAFQMLAGLHEGETFNIMIYNEYVDFFSPSPVLKTKNSIEAAREYLKHMSAHGGTNIHDALVAAIRQQTADGMLPIILFLTDGLPTVGQTSEVVIRDAARNANTFNRRIFTFGVGFDVNAPLLDRIASESRATSSYVLPEEDVEVEVAQLLTRLEGPILTDTQLEVIDQRGRPAPSRSSDMIPEKLRDLFQGDQLVVLGRYLGNEPLEFRLSGNYMGRNRTFRFSFPLDKATTKNAFVPRLWASRRIAVLIDVIRQLGADGTPYEIQAASANDPRIKDLVDSIVDLSIEFGILTEYTAFLATEGTDLSVRDQVITKADHQLTSRAIHVRGGKGAFNQAENINFMKQQKDLNMHNEFLDKNMNRVSINSVQQVNDRAFFRRNGRWVDSRLVAQGDQVQPSKVLTFASKDFIALVGRLAKANRQGCVSLKGEILLEVDGEIILVR